MAISHGMNIEQVEQVGNKLQQRYSTQIEQLMGEMETMVSGTSSSWIGPDAEKFRGWWPEKRSALKAIAADLHGFGQAALNNAQEQRSASGQ